jgi:hypothetical protein
MAGARAGFRMSTEACPVPGHIAFRDCNVLQKTEQFQEN